MCSPLYVTKTFPQKNFYLQGRLLSYSVAGALFGAFGQGLRKLLEIEVIGGIALVIFFLLSLGLVLNWWGKSFHFFSLRTLFPEKTLYKWGQRSAFFQGVLSVALPCGLLYQIFTLAALSHSAFGGFLIGAVHATASAPGLWAGAKAHAALKLRKAWIQSLVRALLMIVIIFNLLFFLGTLLFTNEEAHSKILFCLPFH